jgi:hypothetical protein
MADEEINYTKEMLASDWNLGFIGVMAFLMLVVNFWGFLPLLLAGEIGALFIAQHPRVQRIIRARKNKDKLLEMVSAEDQIVNTLPAGYQDDFRALRSLCEEIERRAGELGDSSANTLLSGVVAKLAAFRIDYARMLQAHHLLSQRNYRNIETQLSRDITQAQQAVGREEATQVRHALAQNLHVLQQRLARVRKLAELVRLLEVRLQVVSNSLRLVQDEVYTFTDVSSISGLVDSLLTNLSISDEFRSTYEDVLNAEAGLMALPELELPALGDGVAPLPTEEPDSTPPRQRQRMGRVK